MSYIIISILILIGRHDLQTVPSPDNDVTDTHSNDPQETINAHICFDLEDKPKQLLKALNSLTVSLHEFNLTERPVGRAPSMSLTIYGP